MQIANSDHPPAAKAFADLTVADQLRKWVTGPETHPHRGPCLPLDKGLDSLGSNIAGNPLARNPNGDTGALTDTPIGSLKAQSGRRANQQLSRNIMAT